MARVLERLRAQARPSIGIALVCLGVLLAVYGARQRDGHGPRRGDRGGPGSGQRLGPACATDATEQQAELAAQARSQAEAAANERALGRKRSARPSAPGSS